MIALLEEKRSCHVVDHALLFAEKSCHASRIVLLRKERCRHAVDRALLFTEKSCHASGSVLRRKERGCHAADRAFWDEKKHGQWSWMALWNVAKGGLHSVTPFVRYGKRSTFAAASGR